MLTWRHSISMENAIDSNPLRPFSREEDISQFSSSDSLSIFMRSLSFPRNTYSARFIISNVVFFFFPGHSIGTIWIAAGTEWIEYWIEWKIYKKKKPNRWSFIVWRERARRFLCAEQKIFRVACRAHVLGTYKRNWRLVLAPCLRRLFNKIRERLHCEIETHQQACTCGKFFDDVVRMLDVASQINMSATMEKRMDLVLTIEWITKLDMRYHFCVCEKCERATG